MHIVGIIVLVLLVLSVPIGIALSAASAAYILIDPLLEPPVDLSTANVPAPLPGMEYIVLLYLIKNRRGTG
jgi:hypothetical protein